MTGTVINPLKQVTRWTLLLYREQSRNNGGR